LSDAVPAGKDAGYDVFISYASLDKTTADAVCAALEAAKTRCWIAPRDITPGADWSAAIVDAIGDCRLFVLVFSANANQSPQIHNEIVQAVNHGLPILPFRIEETIPTKSLAYFMGGVHWLDALTPPLETHIDKLTATVRALLAAQPGGAPVRPRAAAAAPSPPLGKRPVRKGYWPIAAALAGLAVVAWGAYWLAGASHPAPAPRAVVVFTPPTEQDLAHIRDAAVQHGLILPALAFQPPSGDVDPGALRFTGVWSSDIGYNGSGRQAMLIVTTVADDKRAEGYVLGGPPTAHVYDPKIGAYTLAFVGQVDGDTLSVNPVGSKVTYSAKLNLRADAITMSTNRPDGQRAAIVLKPIWRLVNGT
jgi:hypothetical protein